MTGNLIDWLSISLPYNTIFQIVESGEFTINEVASNRRLKPLTDWLSSYDDWRVGQGRKVFDKSSFSEKAGITVFWRQNLPYSLVEITGTGLSELRKSKLVGRFIKLYGNWLTRIDVSRDIVTDTDPRDFAKLRDVKRFSSYDEKVESRGVSYYVGSRTSERYACVYKYAEPHPRAGTMRVEHRLKGDYAKQAAVIIQEKGLSEYMEMLGITFGWSHKDWDLEHSAGKIPSIPRDTKQGKTERWLLTAVLPAVRKLLSNGGDEFVDYFLKQCYDLLNDYRDTKG